MTRDFMLPSGNHDVSGAGCGGAVDLLTKRCRAVYRCAADDNVLKNPCAIPVNRLIIFEASAQRRR